MVSIMQNPFFTSYPYAGQYPYYNGTLSGNCGPQIPVGQTMNSFYRYPPWTPMIEGGRTSSLSAIKDIGLPSTFHNYGFNFGYPQYFNPLFNNQWQSYPYSTWYGSQQPLIPQMWPLYYPYWTNFNMNYGNGTYYSWPMMNYYRHQMQFPAYSWPTPIYWGIQQKFTNELEQGSSGEPQQEQVSNTLEDTPSSVIKDFHVPSVIAKKTVSDIPRSTEYSITLKESCKSIQDGEDGDDLPFVFKVSDTNMQQLAPSRSFGPSMIYNTDSEPNNQTHSNSW